MSAPSSVQFTTCRFSEDLPTVAWTAHLSRVALVICITPDISLKEMITESPPPPNKHSYQVSQYEVPVSILFSSIDPSHTEAESRMGWMRSRRRLCPSHRSTHMLFHSSSTVCNSRLPNEGCTRSSVRWDHLPDLRHQWAGTRYNVGEELYVRVAQSIGGSHNRWPYIRSIIT